MVRCAVGVLGPLEVTVDGRRVEFTAGRLRTVLAVLALSPGQAVPVERLAAALWERDMPGDARRSVQTYVGRVRSALGRSVIDTLPEGYVLRVDAAHVDVARFGALLDAASSAPDPREERERLAAALALWRGTPFDGVPSAWLDQFQRPVLLDRRLTALERRIDLDVAAGRQEHLVAELNELTAANPLREPLWARLLLVLDRRGRRAEALHLYEVLRRRIAEELGVDPGPELQARYADLLADPVAAAPPGRPVPRQLPAEVEGFTGRREQLKALDAVLTDEPAGTVVVVVHGPAGVGKTTLAVRWARSVRDRFPDGQLYLDLRGFDPAGIAVPPAEATRRVLEALGVPQHAIPPGAAERAALYRSHLADRRVLVVLDNVRDADQARTLVPGGDGCLVLVTSRHQMPGLVASVGAHLVGVDVFTRQEAQRFLAGRLTADRLARERPAADEIADLCARLPLALSIVAARAATHPAYVLATLAAELRASAGSLDAFATADRATDLRSVLSWSLRTVSDGAARLFRLLAAHPGPDISVPAAASLAGAPASEVRTLLAGLARVHLIAEPTAGRYALHDLLRTYATELTGRHDRPADRAAAGQRVLDHYLGTATAAARLIDPHQDQPDLPPPRPGTITEDLTDPHLALQWFATEHPVLLAVMRSAPRRSAHRHICALAAAMWVFLERQGRWHDLLSAEREALAAARAVTDRGGQAVIHVALGTVHGKLGRYDDATTALRTAIDIFTSLDDRTATASTCLHLAAVLDRQERFGDAFGYGRDALDLHQAAGNRQGEARALNVLGWLHARTGDHHRAMRYCMAALSAHDGLDDRAGQAATWDSIGYAHQHLGQHRRAISSYRRAVDLRRAAGHRHGEADTLVRLGDAHHAAAESAAARDAWRLALATLDALGHPDADQVRAKLRQLARR